MERVSVLIDKLVQQQKDGEGPAQLLLTVQLLEVELQGIQQPAAPTPRRKVAVVMPLARPVATAMDSPARPAPDQVVQPEPAAQPVPVAEKFEEKKPAHIADKDRNYLPPEPPLPPVAPKIPELSPQVIIKEERRKSTAPVTIAKEHYGLLPAEMDEAPTLMHHTPAPRTKKELHEVLAEKKESLNDKLKEEKKELGHHLSGVPIKDLRKGVGINDKFVFVNELFRGDEAMYERSIKTINAFHILPEAEYWMNRELKVKLGWNDNREVVQHFYAIVRRRFASI